MEQGAPIAADVRRTIAMRLAAIESSFNVEAFYACESGSRAWDFASKDSDYDVRFLYRHPREWYLTLVERRDVIEMPIDDFYDVNGWDLRKALRLAAKSNPVLFEWLSSPIRYLERPLVARFRDAVLPAFDPVKAYHHYLRTARGQRRAYLTGETVRRKKYFYAVRPLLACLHLLDHAGLVPMRFFDLVASVPVPADVKGALEELLDAKRRATEESATTRLPALDRWIDETIAALESRRPAAGPPVDMDRLDAFFRLALDA